MLLSRLVEPLTSSKSSYTVVYILLLYYYYCRLFVVIQITDTMYTEPSVLHTLLHKLFFYTWICRAESFTWHSSSRRIYLSRHMGKPTICIGENKGADQLRSNCEADQRLCFRYSDSTVPLLLKSENSSL